MAIVRKARDMVMAPMGEQPKSESSRDRPNAYQGSVDSKAAEYGAAWTVVGILFSGMLAWGGIGWLVDHWLGTAFFLPVGLIVGSAAGTYLAYKRFGASESEPQPRHAGSTTDGDNDTANADPPSRS